MDSGILEMKQHKRRVVQKCCSERLLAFSALALKSVGSDACADGFL